MKKYILIGISILIILLGAFAMLTTKDKVNIEIKTDIPKQETIGMGAMTIDEKPIKELINSERKIEWIAENNVELTPKKTIQDVDGNDVQVWDMENIKSYGKDGINTEEKERLNILTDAKNFDCAVYKTEKINKAQKEYDKILDVKTVMGN